MASTRHRQRQRSSASGNTESKDSLQRLNSAIYGDRRRSSIGNQLPEDFFEYLDQRVPGRTDTVLTRLGKRFLARFRGGPLLRTHRSNVTVLNSELDSNFSLAATPKRASSLLSISSFRRKRAALQPIYDKKQVTASKENLYMKDNLVLPSKIHNNNEDLLLNGKETTAITLKKEKGGFGFNVVGGIDDEYIPGDPGIFVCRIRANSAASRDKRLKEGDRIISVNGIPLTGKTHDDAVQILRNAETVSVIVIEQDAELRALSKPTNFSGVSSSDESTSSTASSSSKSKQRRSSPKRSLSVSSNSVDTNLSRTMSGSVEVGKSEIAIKPLNEAYLAASTAPINDHAINGHMSPGAPEERRSDDADTTELERAAAMSVQTASPFTSLNAETPKTHQMSDEREIEGDDDNDAEEDRASTASYEAHSVLDDVPRTPKRPSRWFDPSNTSIFNEIIVVSVGVAALGVGVYVGYQFLRRRHIL